MLLLNLVCTECKLFKRINQCCEHEGGRFKALSIELGRKNSLKTHETFKGWGSRNDWREQLINEKIVKMHIMVYRGQSGCCVHIKDLGFNTFVLQFFNTLMRWCICRNILSSIKNNNNKKKHRKLLQQTHHPYSMTPHNETLPQNHVYVPELFFFSPHPDLA